MWMRCSAPEASITMNEIRNVITRYIKHATASRKIVRFKNQKERDSLIAWLAQSKFSKSISRSTPLDLSGKIAECTLCGNGLHKKSGYGNGTNGVMVILNAPRLISPEEKRMLKTEAVDLMKKMLGAIELEAEHCYITNIIKCDPDVDVPPSAMYKNCESFLHEEFNSIKPHTVIVMGQIIPLKNIISASNNVKWFNIEHPVTILKNPELKKGAWNTLREVKKRLEILRDKQ